MSWHNHTGAYPRFSPCATPGLSVARYKAAMEGPDRDAWAGFAITEHAFGIAVPHEVRCWPEHWFYERTAIKPDTVRRRIAKCLEYYAMFRDNKRFFTGIEVESDAAGAPAVPLKRLREFGDVVIAAVHCDMGDFPDWTARHFHHLDKALRIPADILAHPLRRLRPQSPLPREIISETLDRINAAGMAVEINAHYTRIADDIPLLQGAAERGMRVAFSMDLHYPEEFGNWRYFEDVCERAGLDPDKDLKLFNIDNNAQNRFS